MIFSKFNKIKFRLRRIFEIFIIYKPSLGTYEVLHKPNNYIHEYVVQFNLALETILGNKVNFKLLIKITIFQNFIFMLVLDLILLNFLSGFKKSRCLE